LSTSYFDTFSLDRLRARQRGDLVSAALDLRSQTLLLGIRFPLLKPHLIRETTALLAQHGIVDVFAAVGLCAAHCHQWLAAL
jgi:hypothetical protein